MSRLYQFATRNKVSRILYGIFNEYLSYAANTFPNPDYLEKKKFFIYGQGRTGSTLLVNLLNSHPDIFCEREIFMNKNLPFDGQVADFQKMVRGKTNIFRNRIYGFKVKIYQITEQKSISSPRQFLQSLNKAGWSIIYLKRVNAFEHALSNIIAEHLKQYHFSKGENRKSFNNLKLHINTKKLIERISGRIEYANKEESSLKGIPHLKIVYENLSRNKQSNIDNVCDFLNIYRSEVKTKLSKSNTKRYSSLIENYDEVLSALKLSGFESFIDSSKI